MIAAAPVRLVPCPVCGEPSPFTPANRWRPFCSERCRTRDLGAWASERYAIAAPAPPDGDEDDPSLERSP